MKPRLLIIEDEEAIREGLADVFVYKGYEVDTASDGPEGLEKALGGSYHLIILDLMLPGLDGFSLCDQIRAVDNLQPIIMLTAKSGEEDVVKGLKTGADDYVAKPFSIRQLCARVEAVLRRSGRLHQDMKAFPLGPWTIQPDRLLAVGVKTEIQLTPRELEMLVYLAHNRCRPVSRQELLKEVWGYRNVEFMETRTVDIHVTKLRRKLEPDPAQPSLLITVRGEGYQLKAD